jgi:hypothetical protein
MMVIHKQEVIIMKNIIYHLKTKLVKTVGVKAKLVTKNRQHVRVYCNYSNDYYGDQICQSK